MASYEIFSSFTRCSRRVFLCAHSGLDEFGGQYIDEIIIGSSGDTKEELLVNYDRDVRAVLHRLHWGELVPLVSKTDFFVPLVEFCGRVLEKRHTPASARENVGP